MANGNIKTFKVPARLEAAAKLEMKRSGMTQSELYRAALRRYLEEENRFRALQDIGVAAAKKGGLTSEEAIIREAVRVRRRHKNKK